MAKLSPVRTPSPPRPHRASRASLAARPRLLGAPHRSSGLYLRKQIIDDALPAAHRGRPGPRRWGRQSKPQSAPMFGGWRPEVGKQIAEAAKAAGVSHCRVSTAAGSCSMVA